MPHTQFPVAKRPIAAPNAAKPRQRRMKRAGSPSQRRSTALVHDGAGRGLEQRRLAHRSPAAGAEARARRERLAAATARAVLDRRRVHARAVPVVPARVTPRRPACAAARAARGSPRRRSCPCGGRIRAPSARRAPDRAPRPAPAAAGPRGESSSSRSLAGEGSRRNGRATKMTMATASIAAIASARPIGLDSCWSRARRVARGEPALLDRVRPHRDQGAATKRKPAAQMRLISGFTSTLRSTCSSFSGCGPS